MRRDWFSAVTPKERPVLSRSWRSFLWAGPRTKPRGLDAPPGFVSVKDLRDRKLLGSLERYHVGLEAHDVVFQP